MSRRVASLSLIALLSGVPTTKSYADSWNIRRFMGAIDYAPTNMSLEGDNVFYANVRGITPNHMEIWEHNLITDQRRLIRNLEPNGPIIYPDIGGEKIIFSYSSGGLGEMDFKNGEMESLDFGSGGFHPSHNGNQIVWSSLKSSGYSSIRFKDIKSGEEYQLTPNNNERQDYPSIFNNLVVWQENSWANPSWKLVAFDTSTGQRMDIPKMIGDENISYLRPEINQDNIVFERDGDIWLYNLKNKKYQNISSTEFYETNPTIFGDKIAWAQEGPDNGRFQQFYWNYFLAEREVPTPAGLAVVALGTLINRRRRRD